ncbi:MAG: ABC transporter ATP-binding protein [Gammaproteobacteria bacterium]|nr:ABC transporter ATP-binding protein [Gammaproteobacteria bacterium]
MITGITLAVGGIEVVQGVFVVTGLLALMMWVRYFLEPARGMAAWVPEMQTAQASVERVLEVMDAQFDIVSRSNSTNTIPNEITSVEVQNLGFAYDSGVPVLHDVNLRINVGKPLAIVGPIGGWKTTMMMSYGKRLFPEFHLSLHRLRPIR